MTIPRSDMVLLYELKNALTASEFELSSLQHQYEALVPGKSLSLPQQLTTSTTRLGEIIIYADYRGYNVMVFSSSVV